MSSNIKKRPALFQQQGVNINKASNLDGETLKYFRDNTNFFSTASFRYDPPGAGIKSTQQIPIDYSQFENHTFFDSAQAKVNVAFDKIINEFPFDGSGEQVEHFFDTLTGFEKYIYDNFPHSVGYLNFSGTLVGEGDTGTRISVKDSAGAIFPDYSNRTDGATIIDFGTNPFSFEYYLFVSPEENQNQIVFQKQSTANFGMSVVLSQSADISKCNMMFCISSGTNTLQVSASIPKGEFVHVVNEYSRNADNNLKIYFNEELFASSSREETFETLSFNRANLNIGSGSIFNVRSNFMPGGESSFEPVVTLSGALDEVRVFHKNRSVPAQKDYANKTIYAQEGLVLYFKFNEPTGSYTPNSVALDSSGNSLHSIISNYKTSLRTTGSLSSPMSSERIVENPIIFPDYPDVKSLNASLLASASLYDAENPNLITRLIPQHYFLEGQSYMGFETEQGKIFDSITGASIPGSAKLGSSQYLTAFLLIYAKFFDEIKIFLDQVSNVLNVTYDEYESVADQLIPFVARYYGIELPQLFSNSSILEFIDGDNIGDSYAYSKLSLRDLQNKLWKRFLINLPFFNTTKGTITNIKSVIRSFGINPDSLMNIREFGGPTKRSLEDLRYTTLRPLYYIDFSGSYGATPASLDAHGFSSNIPHIVAPYMSSSRVEPGYPLISGTFVDKKPTQRNGISNCVADGLLTSGSFSYEGVYRFLEINKAGFTHPVTQSLVRLDITGSSTSPSLLMGSPVTNLVAISGSSTFLNLFVRPGLNGSSDGGMRLFLTGGNIFDGEPWYVSFGRFRSDDSIMSLSQSYLAPIVSKLGSSSYFLQCARTSGGKIVESYFTSSLFKETSNVANCFSSASNALNVSGTFAIIGSQSLGSTARYFLSDPSLESRSGFKSGDLNLARSTKFTGNVSKVRFWAKGLAPAQLRDHTLDLNSIGSRDPIVFYNFESMGTGSFERIRVDLQTHQAEITSSLGGSLPIINFTQELGNANASGFESLKKIIKSENVFFSRISPNFDLAQTSEKVRVRSYEDPVNIKRNSYSTTAPEYEVRRSEAPDDDVRFSIEFSMVKALEDDIMTLFSNLEFFNNAIGSPNLMFDENYPQLEAAREVYFRRLLAKPEYQAFFDMYKWFSSSLGYILEQMIPKKTKFLGVDFIIESHPLERSRFRYLFDDNYLLSIERSFDRGDLLLSQYVGTLKKF